MEAAKRFFKTRNNGRELGLGESTIALYILHGSLGGELLIR